MATIYEPLLADAAEAARLKEEGRSLFNLDLNRRQLCNLELLLCRAFHPLEGFLLREEYESVLETMRLTDGTLCPLPICLDVTEAQAEHVEIGGTIRLSDREGFPLALLDVADIWIPDKAREARAVFGTDDPDVHPGVRRFLEETGSHYVGGCLRGIHMPPHYDSLDFRLMPQETRGRFARMGWKTVAGFHTERPLHCVDHASILEACRREELPLFLQPAADQPVLVDAAAFLNVRCWQAFAGRFPQDTLLLGILPLAARGAGPREALWQAMVRKNFGCTHFLVAEDQADPFADNGKRPFYARGSAFELLQEYSGETGIEPVALVPMAKDVDGDGFVPARSVPEGHAEPSISADELRHMLERGQTVPDWFTFPEVLDEMRRAHPPRHKQGFTLFLTGLSGAGKSTLAKILYVKFMQAGDRPVTLLDGDIVRRNLSSELTFSREHRHINVVRIGFVAGQITKNGGIAICAPIAPHESARRANREHISQEGGYVEIYLSTPLEVCEKRDRKGLYAKARAGLRKGVTGIDDPYMIPKDPEITLNTSEMSPAEGANAVLLYLKEQGYVR